MLWLDETKIELAGNKHSGSVWHKRLHGSMEKNLMLIIVEDL